MTTSTRVSVVLPAFNHARYIGEALDSVVVQNVDGLEIIVIDDGSSDDTATIAEQILERHSHPYRVIRQPNRGAHAAINAGLSLARGEYISLLNSDDRYVPGRLPTLLDHARRRNGRFLITRIRHIDGAGHPLADETPHRYYYERCLSSIELFPSAGFEFLRHNPASTSGNFFFHHSLLRQVGPFRDYKLCHDWDYLLRALLVEEVVLLDATLYEYRVHPDNTLRPAVDDLRYAEIDDVLSEYLRRAESASNPLAPCARNWGSYWSAFARAELPHLAHLPKIAAALARIAQDSSAPSTSSLSPVHEALLVEALARNRQRVQSLQADLEAAGARTALARPADERTSARALLDRTRDLGRLLAKRVSQL
jgi:glycosyltransferase involved in cell wall biosynthesis